MVKPLSVDEPTAQKNAGRCRECMSLRILMHGVNA